MSDSDRPFAAFDDESLLILASLMSENISGEGQGGMGDIYQDELQVLRERALDEIELRGLTPNETLHSLLTGLLSLRHSPPPTEEEKAAFREFEARISATMEKVGRSDGPMEAQDPGPWRKINVILPRHELRERDHQRRQRNADNSLRGQTIWSWPLSGRRACPPSPRLERALHRDDASVRAYGHLAICANLYEREGGGSDGNPDYVAAKVRAEGGIADSQMVGDTEAAVKCMAISSG
jgi:hypothetical protein